MNARTGYNENLRSKGKIVLACAVTSAFLGFQLGGAIHQAVLGEAVLAEGVWQNAFQVTGELSDTVLLIQIWGALSLAWTAMAWRLFLSEARDVSRVQWLASGTFGGLLTATLALPFGVHSSVAFLVALGICPAIPSLLQALHPVPVLRPSRRVEHGRVPIA
ncbi:MAG: hypothetical protein JNM85_00030 [Chthonomonas sp.]|nr:hypothetical protein [Chthonomonas sp.]